MTIDSRCQEQKNIADKMFMDFKYTEPGSDAQVKALKTLSFLISMWGDFLFHEERRMASALTLESSS